MVTWIGLAFGAVLLVLALGLLRPRLAVPSFVALGLVMALMVATRMPADGPIMVANTSRLKPTFEVFNEVARGRRAIPRTSDAARSCATRPQPHGYAHTIRSSAERSFERFWHTPFCHLG